FTTVINGTTAVNATSSTAGNTSHHARFVNLRIDAIANTHAIAKEPQTPVVHGEPTLVALVHVEHLSRAKHDAAECRCEHAPSRPVSRAEAPRSRHTHRNAASGAPAAHARIVRSARDTE